MRFEVKGITLELPDNVLVSIAADGNTVKIDFDSSVIKVEEKIVEKIKIVEVPTEVHSGEIKVVEKIKMVEVPVECEKCKNNWNDWGNLYRPWNVPSTYTTVSGTIHDNTTYDFNNGFWKK